LTNFQTFYLKIEWISHTQENTVTWTSAFRETATLDNYNGVSLIRIFGRILEQEICRWRYRFFTGIQNLPLSDFRRRLEWRLDWSGLPSLSASASAHVVSVTFSSSSGLFSSLLRKIFLTLTLKLNMKVTIPEYKRPIKHSCWIHAFFLAVY